MSHHHSKPVLLVCKPALFQILRSSFPLQLHPFCPFLRCFWFEFARRMTSSKSRFTLVIPVKTCRSVSAKLYINCWLILASLPLQLHPFCLFLRCFRFEFTWKIWLVLCLGLSFPSEYSQACQPSYKFSCWLILASVGYAVSFLLLKIRKLN